MPAGAFTRTLCRAPDMTPYAALQLRQIGEELFIATKTASIHVSRILSKVGVASRGEAAAQALRIGLVLPPR